MEIYDTLGQNNGLPFDMAKSWLRESLSCEEGKSSMELFMNNTIT